MISIVEDFFVLSLRSDAIDFLIYRYIGASLLTSYLLSHSI